MKLTKHRSSQHTIDMCNGPLLPSLIAFSLPLMLGSILQVFYNAADMIVIGQFSGETATASVGATSSLLALLVTSFIGFSVGVNVLAARYIGACDREELHQTVQTAIYAGALLGLLLGVVCFTFARLFLQWMACPADVLDGATLYMRCYALGVPGSMIYNFGTAILNAKGDTRRPLRILAMSGLVNVLLNLFFVLLLHIDVAGVALATSIANWTSAGMVLYDLIREKSDCRFDPRVVRISGKKLWHIVRIGIPVAIQSSLYSISNVQIQAQVNSFGAAAIAANSASTSLEGFPSAANSAFSNAAISFASQNVGAERYERIKQIFFKCTAVSTIFCEVIGMGLFLLSGPLLNIYLPGNTEAIAIGQIRMSLICTIYCIAGATNVAVSITRALGYSTLPMLVSVFCVCGLRALWLWFVYPHFPTLLGLWMCYPVTWTIALVAQWVCLWFTYRDFFHRRAISPENARPAAKEV